MALKGSPQIMSSSIPIKVTILTPGAVGERKHAGARHSGRASSTKFLSSRRIEIEKTGLYSFLVLFSMGITKGKWSTLVTELLNFKDLYDANAPLSRVLPALAEAHPEAYSKMGLKDLCQQIHQAYREDNLPQGADETSIRRCRRWRCGPPMPMRGSCAGKSRASRSTI